MLDHRIMICRCPGGVNGETHRRRLQEHAAQQKVYAARVNEQRVNRLEAEIQAMTVKADQYDIMEAKRVGHHLVLKVRYPSCTKCTFEGIKVMVFLNIDETEAMRWKRIDPHFRKPKVEVSKVEPQAPSPSARFPGSDEGWEDAIAYAKSKCDKTPRRQGEW